MALTVFPSTRAILFHFTPYNQTLAHAVTEVLLWHVSCDLLSKQDMSFVVLSKYLILQILTNIAEFP
jgi:hypothetical protein